MRFANFLHTTIKHVSLEKLFSPNEIARPARSPIANSRRIIATIKLTLEKYYSQK